MMKIVDILKAAWLEILLGIFIILIADFRWFLFYSFIVFLLVSAGAATEQTDYLRKLIRINDFFAEIRTLAIVRKLKVSNDEMSIIFNEAKRTMGEDNWKGIEKDIRDLISDPALAKSLDQLYQGKSEKTGSVLLRRKPINLR